MANRYRVAAAPHGWPDSLPFRLGVPGRDKDYGVGEEFEHAFTVDEEAANLASGLLEIVPREYRVVGGSRVHETDQGETFTRALTIGEEQFLVDGGHVEPVEAPAPTPKKTRKEVN